MDYDNGLSSQDVAALDEVFASLNNTSGLDFSLVEGLDEDDVSGLQDEDTGLVSPQIQAQIEALLRRFPAEKLDKKSIAGMLTRALSVGGGKKRTKPAVRDTPPQIRIGRRALVKGWNKTYPQIRGIKQRGFYFDTQVIEFSVEGTSPNGVLRLSKKDPLVTWFGNYVEDQVTIFGQPTLKSIADTNLVRLGPNQYPKQIFLIEGVEFVLRAVYIAYDDATINASAALTPFMKEVLTGKHAVYDDAGIFLPKEFFHDYTEACEMFRALASSTSIWFSFKQQDVGGGAIIRNHLIDVMRALPHVGRGERSVINRETAGGAELPYLRSSYLWNLDQNASNATTFTAYAAAARDFAFPFIGIDPRFGILPILPIKVGFAVEMRVRGDSIRDKEEVERQFK